MSYLGEHEKRLAKVLRARRMRSELESSTTARLDGSGAHTDPAPLSAPLSSPQTVRERTLSEREPQAAASSPLAVTSVSSTVRSESASRSESVREVAVRITLGHPHTVEDARRVASAYLRTLARTS